MARKTIEIEGSGIPVSVEVTDRFREKEQAFFWPLIGDYPLYDRYIYLVMLADEEREQVYREAIRRQCPGRVAVDVGTGDSAVWARACAEVGARKVYAVEENPESVRRARAAVAEAGLAGQIEVIEGRADRVSLPEQAEVMVSEVIGEIASSEGAAAILNDIRRRWMAPGAVSIPGRCRSWISPVSLPLALVEAPKLEWMGVRYLHRIFSLAGHPFDPRLSLDNAFEEIEQGQLSSAQVLEDLDFGELCPEAGVEELEFVVERPGRLDGLAIWIELFADGETVAISSMTPGSNWRPVWVPLFSPGREVARGDVLRLRWSWELSENGIHPDYVVTAQLMRQEVAEGEETVRLSLPRYGKPGAFRQHPFFERLFPAR